MGATSPEFAQAFRRETWILFSIGVLVAILRFTARIRRLGIRNLQVDDYLMVFGLIWYTILCVAINEVIFGGGSNLMTQEDIDNLTPETHAERVRGSKWVFVSEHAMQLAIWSCKGCMLVIYARMTSGLSKKRLVNYLSIYVGLGFIGSELALFLTCIPIQNYWAVPTPNYQCSSYQHYEIIQGCFAITADIAMLVVAIPIVARIRVPLRKKLILLILFGMGIFVIVSAVLTKVYCLVPSLISYVYLNWYFREATVAVLVTNLPLVWSLLRDLFPSVGSWGGSKKTSDRYHYQGTGTGPSGRTFSSRRRYGPGSQIQPDYDLQDLETNGKASGSASTSATEERNGASSDDDSARALHIRQDITVTIRSEEKPAESHDHQPQNWPLKTHPSPPRPGAQY